MYAGVDRGVPRGPPGRVQPCAGVLDPDESFAEWLANPSGPSPIVKQQRLAASALTEAEVTVTPRSLGDLAHSSLYVQGLTVLRTSAARSVTPTVYAVDSAFAVDDVLADTGAAPSLITTELLEQLPADCLTARDQEASVAPINGADGTPLRLRGTVVLTFQLHGTACRHQFSVIEGRPLLILGTDFLAPRHAVIRMNIDGQGRGELEMRSPLLGNDRENPTEGSPVEYVTHSTPVSSRAERLAAAVTPQPHCPNGARLAAVAEVTSVPLPAAVKPADYINESTDLADHRGWRLQVSEHLLYSQEPIKLPARSLVTVRVRAPKALEAVAPTCLVDRLPNRDGLEEPPQVVPRTTSIVDGYVELQILNTRRCAHTIAGNLPIALLDSEYHVRGSVDPKAVAEHSGSSDYLAQLDPEQLAVIDAVTVDPEERLTAEQKLRVRQLLAEHVSAFATDPKNPTKTHLLEVELPLKPGAVPHRHAPSRLGEVGRAYVEKEVAEMESRGIIRKSNSAWGSRVVLVTKKDGSVRFCVDYRDCNAKLQVQDSPLPLCVEAIDRLSSGEGDLRSLFLCTLDLASGFWTLPIAEASKPLTAFVTHRQKYEFNYLPFGIQSGPSYMCRLMDAALQGLAWETCMPYLDDVGIWSTGTGDTPEAR